MFVGLGTSFHQVSAQPISVNWGWTTAVCDFFNFIFIASHFLKLVDLCLYKSCFIFNLSSQNFKFYITNLISCPLCGPIVCIIKGMSSKLLRNLSWAVQNWCTTIQQTSLLLIFHIAHAVVCFLAQGEGVAQNAYQIQIQ